MNTPEQPDGWFCVPDRIRRRTGDRARRRRASRAVRVGLFCALALWGHVALAQLLDPFRVVAKRPVFTYPAAGDRAERVSSAGMDQGEVEVAEQEEEGHVHQPVVHDQRVLEAESVVALAVPEEEAGDGEENGERGGDDRVDL